MLKKIKKQYLSIVILLFASPKINCYEDFEDFSFFNDPQDAHLDALIAQEAVNAPNNPAIPVECLIRSGGIGVLQEPIFLNTNPIRSRSLLDYPDYLPQRIYEKGWTIGSHLFFNETYRCVFDGNSTNISSYLAIQSPTLLEKLNKCADLLGSILPFSPPTLLSLFKNATISERRTGFMFHTQRQWNNTRFRAMTPLYYLERNFFLTECEQRAIEKVLGKTSQDEQYLFAKQHLISDKFGLGDTRLTIDTTVYESENLMVNIGGLMTLPTAFTIGKNWLGSTFKKVEERPILDIEKLFFQLMGTQPEKAAAQDAAKKFGFGILDNLAANLLTTKLGNNGHIGIGAYYEAKTKLQKFIKLPWAQNFTIRSRASAEYLLPKTETRSFVVCNDAQLFEQFDLNRSIEEIVKQIETDPAYAQAVLTFLENQLVDRLYPFAFKAQVNPGVILRTTSKIFYDVRNWGFYFGSDFWFQSSEYIKNVRICRESDNRPLNIDLDKARNKWAYESKIIGGAFWKVDRDNHEWLLGLNGDCTTFGSGIGNNFTLSFNMEVNF